MLFMLEHSRMDFAAGIRYLKTSHLDCKKTVQQKTDI